MQKAHHWWTRWLEFQLHTEPELQAKPRFLSREKLCKARARARRRILTLKSSYCALPSSSSSLALLGDAMLATPSRGTSEFGPDFFGLVSRPSSLWGLRWVSGGGMPWSFWVRESSIASLLIFKNKQKIGTQTWATGKRECWSEF